ncbi:branched-chain amino acid ABC transporter substrate-binding protein [Solirubrobacter soli]|uniref:branched-chain amino acid ABC transporter substrate-binding protein n=1 Tax=Solirubrobacter soli TaxID=363832 RepID=UPI0004027A1A|nr:branched-chain amino acid ABC transporter substrate-binding protein [Solirubrobacter soli]
MSRSRTATGCVVVALGFSVAACGDDGNDDASTGGSGSDSAKTAAKSVTVYSSFPLQGAGRAQSEAAVNGAKLALEQAGGKAGDISVTYTPLDDATAQAANWTPEQTSANARKAAQDKSTAAYIGEFNSGASAVSIPILNEAGIAQISPSNTAVGLTTDEPGANPGEPDKYYPTGTRTFTRIVPKDTIQGAALATLMKEDGCTKVQLLNDKEVYGAGLAKNIQSSAEAQGLTITSNEATDKNAANYRSLAQKAKTAGADCMVFSGITANNAAQIFKDFAAALPTAKLYGPDGVADSGFASPKEGIPADVAKRTKVTIATLSPDQYPPEGQEFFKTYTEKYGEQNPDPYAIYGYETMALALDAITRSKTGEKADVVKALFATKDRKSVLGTYSIDANGDTSLTDYGIYSIADGNLKFDKTIKAQGS